MKTPLLPVLLLILGTAVASHSAPRSVPELPKGVKISYPTSNPLRDALGTIPTTAIFAMDGFFLWDPSVIQVGDTYHLFASRWPAANGMQGWKKSHVIRATSKNLFGPYQFQEVALSPSTHPWATEAIHNPKVMKVGTKYLIYHLGIPQWKTGFAYADAIEGPWMPVAKPVISTNNPALLVRADGSVYAVGKFKPKETKDGKWDACMQAFEATQCDGPYRLIGDQLNRLPNGFELEDPTVWWANNQYNVICTDWEAKVTGIEKALVYYTSSDGINYTLYSQIPVWSQHNPVPATSGESIGIIEISAVERPQVYVNAKGAVQALLAAVRPPGKNDPSYIMIRPVADFVPKN